MMTELGTSDRSCHLVSPVQAISQGSAAMLSARGSQAEQHLYNAVLQHPGVSPPTNTTLLQNKRSPLVKIPAQRTSKGNSGSSAGRIC